MIALLAAGHIYVTLGKLLFLLPATEKACSVSQVRYGPSSRKWERGTNPPQTTCEFHQYVAPGALTPVWGEAGESGAEELEVVYQVPGEAKPRLLTLKPETVEPKGRAKLSASLRKSRSSVRVEVKNGGDAPVLVGDAVASRARPHESCEGNGPAIAIAPGETLVDLRPGLLSPSMKAYVAVFAGEKDCRWVEVTPR